MKLSEEDNILYFHTVVLIFFIAPETIHPSLWRAYQLARGTGVYVASGHTALSAELNYLRQSRRFIASLEDAFL